MRRFDRYMGIPYRDAGRGFDGADCFGLYMLIVFHEAGIALEEPGVSYGADAAAVRAKIEAEMRGGQWTPIAAGDGAAVKHSARCLDAVQMSAHVHAGGTVIAADLHIGCAIGGGLMIHTEKGTGPRCVALDDPSIARRVRAVWRPRVLT